VTQPVLDSRRRILRLIFATAPLGMMLFVSSVTILIGRAASHLAPDRIARILSARCEVDYLSDSPALLKQYSGYFNYAALSMLYLFVCVGVVLFVVALLASLDIPLKLRAALVLVATILAVGSSFVPWAYPWPLLTGLLDRPPIRNCSGAAALFMRQERMSAFVAVMTAVAACALVYFARGSERRLALRLRQANWILYAAALQLVTGILRIDALYQWVALAETDAKLAQSVALLGSALTRIWGTYFTLVLASVYLPSHAMYRLRASRIAPPDLTSEQSDQWLRSLGLNSTLTERLPRILAILSPFIAGQATDLLRGMSH
jgi:hypothetical protein